MLIMVTFFFGPIIYFIHKNALPVNDPRISFFFNLQFKVFNLLFLLGLVLPSIYMIRNRPGIGNRVVIKEDSIVVPNNMWLINPFKDKEVEVAYVSIADVEIDDQTEKYGFKKIVIRLKNNKCYKLTSKIVDEDQFNQIYSLIKSRLVRDN